MLIFHIISFLVSVINSRVNIYKWSKSNISEENYVKLTLQITSLSLQSDAYKTHLHFYVYTNIQSVGPKFLEGCHELRLPNPKFAS